MVQWGDCDIQPNSWADPGWQANLQHNDFIWWGDDCEVDEEVNVVDVDGAVIGGR